MFKLIGGAIVFGFALYGLVTYLDRTKPQAVIKPSDAGQPAGTDDAEAAYGSERGGVAGLSWCRVRYRLTAR